MFKGSCGQVKMYDHIRKWVFHLPKMKGLKKKKKIAKCYMITFITYLAYKALSSSQLQREKKKNSRACKWTPISLQSPRNIKHIKALDVTPIYFCIYILNQFIWPPIMQMQLWRLRAH